MLGKKDRHRDQLKAFFLWASSIVQESDIICIDLFFKKAFYYFRFPLRFGDKPKRIWWVKNSIKPTFIIRKPKLSDCPGDSWIKIFSSPEFEIFENKIRILDTPPLRWGLTDEEKKITVKIARDALDTFLNSREHKDVVSFQGLPRRFDFPTDIDVALWVRGGLRGSCILEGRALGTGVVEAALRASRDYRFQPISPDELAHTRIEITVMHSLHIPLSTLEREGNRIYYEKGYLLKYADKKGWFLPEVLNVRRFRNFEEYLGDLAEEKAGVDRSFHRGADIFIFEIDDFIESQNHEEVMPLLGPVVLKNDDCVSVDFVTQKSRMAADWFSHIQQPSGNIPPIIDFLNGGETQIDWPRLAFTAWALAEFGKVLKEEKYVKVAENSFEFLKKYLINDKLLSIKTLLALSYFGQLAYALGKTSDALSVSERIVKLSSRQFMEPITFSQVASFLKIIVRLDKKFMPLLESISAVLRENFESNLKNNKERMNLAALAELVNTFYNVDQGFSEKVAYWLCTYQLPDGAFPESTVSNFVYTRGTGKIFEVLALDPEKNKAAIEKSLTWLFSMQYDEENTFFVSEKFRPKIIGGFRHDYFNQEVWIDSAGHVLLGMARMLSRLSQEKS